MSTTWRRFGGQHEYHMYEGEKIHQINKKASGFLNNDFFFLLQDLCFFFFKFSMTFIFQDLCLSKFFIIPRYNYPACLAPQ